jgi:hypothetical protein
VSVAVLIADLVKAGVDATLVGRVAQAIAEAAQPATAKDAAAEKRRAYDRERKRNSTGIPPEHAEDHSTGNSTGIPPETAALTRVRDNPSRLVITGQTVVDVSASAGDQPDDWPTGNHVEALVAEVSSPRLDPDKSQGLHLTAGRLVAWRRDGASWQFDVLPVVKAACAKSKTPIATWKYFDTAISVSIAENRRALEIPDAAATPRGQGPPMTFAAQIGAENTEARRRAFELLDARKTQNG